MSDQWARIIASLRLETPEGTIAVVDGRTLHLAERFEAPRRYWLAVLRAIVDQLEARVADPPHESDYLASMGDRLNWLPWYARRRMRPPPWPPATVGQIGTHIETTDCAWRGCQPAGDDETGP